MAAIFPECDFNNAPQDTPAESSLVAPRKQRLLQAVSTVIRVDGGRKASPLYVLHGQPSGEVWDLAWTRGLTPSQPTVVNIPVPSSVAIAHQNANKASWRGRLNTYFEQRLTARPDFLSGRSTLLIFLTFTVGLSLGTIWQVATPLSVGLALIIYGGAALIDVTIRGVSFLDTRLAFLLGFAGVSTLLVVMAGLFA